MTSEFKISLYGLKIHFTPERKNQKMTLCPYAWSLIMVKIKHKIKREEKAENKNALYVSRRMS